MALKVPQSGRKIALGAMLNKTAPQDLTLKLFKNNVTPGDTDTAATFTESDFTGYAAINLTAANWTITDANPESAAYPQQTFTSSAAQVVQQAYGYFVVQVTSGLLVYAERFTDGPYPISNNGDNVKVTPTITGTG